MKSISWLKKMREDAPNSHLSGFKFWPAPICFINMKTFLCEMHNKFVFLDWQGK